MNLDWICYNHAIIPATAPHISPDFTEVCNGRIWNKFPGEGAIFARWTSHYDCGYKTGWYYVITDKVIDISQLKAKRRYEINKGLKMFEIRKIVPVDWADELADICVRAWAKYPERYRPKTTWEEQYKQIRQGLYDDSSVYAAFTKGNKNQIIAGFSVVRDKGEYFSLSQQKCLPEYEKMAINAALIYGVLLDLKTDIENGKYLCDGARNIVHSTAFQDYLEKYFGFRKAYCWLHTKYRFPFDRMINILYPFRKFFYIFNGNGFVSKIVSLLKQEEIVKMNSCYEKMSV